jgi:hypothetical protein
LKLSARKLAGKALSVFWDPIEKERDLHRCEGMDTDTVKSVCLILGPYRNLTTLTASVLFLHPQCQVLNHGSRRIFGDDRIDFIKDYSEARYARFVRYALCASENGRRGSHGGSITRSHAVVDRPDMLQAMEQLGPKDAPTALVWKESLRTANHLRACGIDPGNLLKDNSQLRFLLPIRHPIDCATSNVRTGHVRVFEGLDRSTTVEDALAAVVKEIAWFRRLQRQHPHRFHHYFGYDAPAPVLHGLAGFLDLDAPEQWLRAGTQAFQVGAQYEHSQALVDCYRNLVGETFTDDPEFSQGLLAFVSA